VSMAANDGERKAGRFRDTNAAVLDRLRAMRGPGESYSDVILRPMSFVVRDVMALSTAMTFR
jgi:hypothetical protein